MMKNIITTALVLFALSPLSALGAQIAVPPSDDSDDSQIMHCPDISQTLRRGMRDATTRPQGQVSELQTFLVTYFDLDEETYVSGFFGRQTQNYVIQFQQKHGLPAYGVAGTLTRQKIAEVCKSGTGVVPDGEYGGPQCKQWTDGTYCGTTCTRKYPGAKPECFTKACAAYGPVDAKPKCTEYFEDRPVACTMEYAPVCGKPKYCFTSKFAPGAYPRECEIGKTYGNKCSMNGEGAEFMHMGECRGATVSCPIYQIPRCATGEEVIKGEKQADGCYGAPYCKPITVCPAVAYQACPPGTYDANGPTKPGQCPQPPVCKPGVTKCGVNSFGVRGAQCGGTTANGASASLAIMVAPPDMEPAYPAAYFECYDGYTETMGGDTSCKPVSVWQKYAQERCANRCKTSAVTGATQTASPYESFMWVVDNLRAF
jgi:hypothetical protein